MKLSKLLISLAVLILCSCMYTPDSVKVFDRDQARELIEESGFVPAGQEQVLVKLPPGTPSWKKISRAGSGLGYTFSYIPVNASEQNWHELMERKIIPYGKNLQRNAKNIAQDEIQIAHQSCSKVQTKILDANNQFVMYQLNCTTAQGENQYQIAKIFNGHDLIYVVRYTALTGQVPEVEVNALSGAIQSAILIPTRR